jgi:hypothetical protein
MSKISTFYDALITLINNTFTGSDAKLELDDPYNPENNNEVILKNGFGVQIGELVNDKRTLEGKTTFSKRVSVIFTRQHFGSDRNAAVRRTTEKNLLEDELTLIKAIWNDGGTLSSSVSHMIFETDGGIESIFNDKTNFLMLRMDFNIKYIETITS